MALTTLKQAGYGIFEVNNMTAQEVRTFGSLPLKIEDFANNAPCEQGMLLVYDEATGVVRKPTAVTEKVMIHNSDYKLYDVRDSLKDFALFAQEGTVISEITQYQIDEFGGLILDANGKPQKDTVKSKSVTIYNDKTPYPRMFSCVTNDRYTTNTVVYDTETFATLDALATDIAAGTVYAVAAVDAATGNSSATDAQKEEAAYAGYHKLVKTVPTGAVNVFKAIKFYDLPDGQPAIRFEVWN